MTLISLQVLHVLNFDYYYTCHKNNEYINTERFYIHTHLYINTISITFLILIIKFNIIYNTVLEYGVNIQAT